MKYELGNYRLKMYELNGYWNLEFLYKNETHMKFIHVDKAIIEHDFNEAKRILMEKGGD